MPKLPRTVRERRTRPLSESGASARRHRSPRTGRGLGAGRNRSGRPGARALELVGIGRTPSVRAVVEFTRSFAVMVNARISIVEALGTASQQVDDARLQETLADVAHRVTGGDELSAALARHPEAFGALYVHLVRVGEVAGLLDVMLLRLASYLEKGQALKRRLRLALAYPAVVLTVAVGVTVFLLAVIVPTFAEMFADFGAELPMPTRLVISASDLLQRYAVLLVALVGACVFGVRYAVRTEVGAMRWDRLKLRVPLTGSLYRKALTARFCSTLGTLVGSGVPLTDALEVTAGVVDNGVVEGTVREMKRRVVRGSSLAAPLEKAVSDGVSVFPPMVVQMITVGEETARLGEMLDHVAGHYEGEVDTAVDALASVIEPVMIVLLGIVLGAILISIYLPMFELTNAIQ